MRIRSIAYVAAAALALSAGAARADVTITIEQVGSDVVATGSGSIDLAGLTFLANDSAEVAIFNRHSNIIMFKGHGFVSDEAFFGASGPSSFGSGPGIAPSSGSGDAFGVVNAMIHLPRNYASGTSLSATDTYAGQTLSSLGLTPGTYVYTWGSDSLTVQVGPAAAAPEPSSALAVAFGSLAGLGVWVRRIVAGR